MKQLSGHPIPAERADLHRRASHLCDAILQRAQERHHTAGELAQALDMSLGHWYRIRKDPLRLGRLTLARLDAIARYVSWPRVQVMVAAGLIQQAEIDQVIVRQGVIESALQRLRHAGIANGLATPIERASPDHQILMARLLIAAENTSATGPK